MSQQAFPIYHGGYGRADDYGMTLRDYFAAKAMQSILLRSDSRFSTTLEFVGGKAYQYADAMLKARDGNS